MFKIYSPFEDSGIFSFFWFLLQADCIDLFLLSNLNKPNQGGFFYSLILDFFYKDSSFCFSTLVSDISDWFSNYYDSFFQFLSSNYSFILFLVCFFVSFFCFKRSFIRSNKISYILFNIISDFVYNRMVLQYLGLNGKRYFSFFLFLFYFILCSNLFGLIPGIFALASNLTVTLFLSSMAWLGIFLVGLFFHGKKFFSSFFPSKVPFLLAPYLMSIEFLSYLVRLASLSLRLFANIVAGHILLDTISLFFFYISYTTQTSLNYNSSLWSLFLLFFLFVMIFFELLIAILQAYIFVILVIIYLNDSLHLHV